MRRVIAGSFPLFLAALLILGLAPARSSALHGGAMDAAPVDPREGDQAKAPVAEMVPGGTITPKDFAFIHANGQFHLFYIRHDDSLPDSLTETELGHAVSTDLFHWTQLAPVIPVEPARWDDAHVWSPSIIFKDGTYYLFYTGVSSTPGYSVHWGYQRIGVATSTDLMNWTRYPAPVFGGDEVPWAFADSTRGYGCQFRDPFVMEDPSNSGRWLMYYVTTPRVQLVSTIVGVGQNATGLAPWSDLKPFWNTDTLHYQQSCESPHVFQESGLWYLLFTTNSGHPIQVQYATSALADSSGWYGTWSLYSLLGANNPDIDTWFASEHLTFGGHDYLAFVHSGHSSIQIRELAWGPPPFLGAPPVLSIALPSVAGIEQTPVPLELALASAGREYAPSLRATLPSPMHALVEVFDTAGRRVRRVLDGTLPAGVTMLSWNGIDDAQAPVPGGIYFARMRTPAGVRSARVLLVR